MSNNLDLDQVAGNQNQKEITINDQAGQLDAALTEQFVTDVSAGNTTLTDAEYRGAVFFKITGATVASRSVTLPTIKRLVAIASASDATQSVDIVVGATTIALPATESIIVYTDGTTDGLLAITGGSGGGGSSTYLGLTDTPSTFTSEGGKAPRVNVGETAIEFVDVSFDVGGSFGGVPGVSVVIFQFLFTRAVNFPTNLTLSQGKASVAATAQTDFDLRKNNVSFGTMRFAALGTTSTFITSATSFAAGDEITVISPNPADATLANLSFTFAGTA